VAPNARQSRATGRTETWPETGALNKLSAWLVLVVLFPLGAGCQAVSTGQNMQGVRLYEQGQYYAALERFQRAMATDPQDANAFYNVASTLHQLGRTSNNSQMLQQAETYYNKCLDRSPDHPACYRGLAVLLADTNRTDRAETLLKNWALRSPQSAEPRVELARLYEELGDKKTAEIQLQQAIQLDQGNKRAWTAMAYLREKNGNYEQALANYQRAYSLNHYNQAIAHRIAALNQATGSSISSPLSPTGTRTVQTPLPTARY